MLFHTWPFLYFFTIVFFGYLALRRTRWWQLWLLIASYTFYSYSNPLFLGLLFYSTFIDYWCVNRMEGSAHRRRWLAVSLLNNLLILGYFKYAVFLATAVNDVFVFSGIPFTVEVPNLSARFNEWFEQWGWSFRLSTEMGLPVGISFFTFQSMSYSIDYFRRQIPRETSFIRFATFVSFFPQLVAGPIERASKLLPQMRVAPTINWTNICDGVSLFITGLFKKVALSNYLASYADPVFQLPERHDGATLVAATFAFAWQIYFDFSGYTDMARGVARAMGFDLMLNFKHPYLATGLSDFWNRWHISLSTWFRDYVYIPLGGNRRGSLATYRNLFLTMVISGIWHGAAWTFVIWGTLHGLGMMLSRAIERSDWYQNRIPRFPKQMAVFVFVCFGWIYFRSTNLADANLIVRRIVGTAWSDPRLPTLLLILIAAVWTYQWFSESAWRQKLELAGVKIALAAGMLIYLAFVPAKADIPFIYFQF